MVAPIVRSLFAVQLFETIFEGYEEHVPALIERIEKTRDKPVKASNRFAFHSHRNFHVGADPATTWLRDSIRKFGEQTLVPRAPADRPAFVHILGCWAIAASAGDWLEPHTHFPVPWSGVFYLQAQHTVTEPKERTGCLELLCPVASAEAFGMPLFVSIPPVDGRALMFPGALPHMVNPHLSKQARYSVSFNLALRNSE